MIAATNRIPQAVTSGTDSRRQNISPEQSSSLPRNGNNSKSAIVIKGFPSVRDSAHIFSFVRSLIMTSYDPIVWSSVSRLGPEINVLFLKMKNPRDEDALVRKDGVMYGGSRLSIQKGSDSCVEWNPRTTVSSAPSSPNSPHNYCGSDKENIVDASKDRSNSTLIPLEDSCNEACDDRNVNCLKSTCSGLTRGSIPFGRVPTQADWDSGVIFPKNSEPKKRNVDARYNQISKKQRLAERASYREQDQPNPREESKLVAALDDSRAKIYELELEVQQLRTAFRTQIDNANSKIHRQRKALEAKHASQIFRAKKEREHLQTHLHRVKTELRAHKLQFKSRLCAQLQERDRNHYSVLEMYFRHIYFLKYNYDHVYANAKAIKTQAQTALHQAREYHNKEVAQLRRELAKALNARNQSSESVVAPVKDGALTSEGRQKSSLLLAKGPQKHPNTDQSMSDFLQTDLDKVQEGGLKQMNENAGFVKSHNSHKSGVSIPKVDLKVSLANSRKPVCDSVRDLEAHQKENCKSPSQM